ncbi:MAG: hypothetical protein ACE145_03740 [Terriglobia bacterium]
MVKTVNFGQGLLRALSRQRLGVGAALAAAVLLIGVFHAPVAPVLIGCAVGLAFILLRAGTRDS